MQINTRTLNFIFNVWGHAQGNRDCRWNKFLIKKHVENIFHLEYLESVLT